jgi:hypothetical protein
MACELFRLGVVDHPHVIPAFTRGPRDA